MYLTVDDYSNTASSRRKARKKATGRKGTVDEFEYLLASMGRLVARVEEKTGMYLEHCLGFCTDPSLQPKSMHSCRTS